MILTPLPAKNIIPFPSPTRRGLGRGGKGLGVRFFDVLHATENCYNEVCKFGGDVGWMDTDALKQEIDFIKSNFCTA